MKHIGAHAFINGKIVALSDAHLPITCSAVLYGLSVYSVVFIKHTASGWLIFRIKDHLERLRQSAQLIGFSGVPESLDEAKLISIIRDLLSLNQSSTDQLCRITLHLSANIPGVRTRNLPTIPSVFLYDANPILPSSGARIKTSSWRRTSDNAIPPRAKVNGAYVNSALAKQEAIDCGYDDALFLNQNGYVSELTASNLFLVKRGELITPDPASDILEGITRRSIIDIARSKSIPVIERKVALTELYTADELFACGTSAFVSPLVEVDSRTVGTGETGIITEGLRNTLLGIQVNSKHDWITLV